MILNPLANCRKIALPEEKMHFPTKNALSCRKTPLFCRKMHSLAENYGFRGGTWQETRNCRRAAQDSKNMVCGWRVDFSSPGFSPVWGAQLGQGKTKKPKHFARRYGIEQVGRGGTAWTVVTEVLPCPGDLAGKWFVAREEDSCQAESRHRPPEKSAVRPPPPAESILERAWGCSSPQAALRLRGLVLWLDFQPHTQVHHTARHIERPLVKQLILSRSWPLSSTKIGPSTDWMLHCTISAITPLTAIAPLLW